MKNEGLQPVNFVEAERDYGKRFPLEMGILRIGGVYPGERNEGTINPYTRSLDTEYFGNIGEHCLAVAKCAETIAKAALPDKPLTVNEIVRRSLVHDATKRYEIMRKKAVRNGSIEDAYSTSAYATIKPLLEEKGVADDIIEYMANAGSEAGHNSLASFVTLVDDTPVLKTNDNITRMIVHLADDMTYAPIVTEGDAPTSFVTTQEKMDLSDFPSRYPFMYIEGFGFDQGGNVIHVKNIHEIPDGIAYVKTYAEWQPWVSGQIAKHLACIINSDIPTEHAEIFIKDFVNSSL